MKQNRIHKSSASCITISGNTIGKLIQNIGIPGDDIDQQHTRVVHINNCRGPIVSFTGRSQELLELRKLFSQHNIVVVCGVSGVGKTQLVRKYAWDNRDNYNCLFWIQAETEGSLVECFHQLAAELNINVIKGNITRSINQILNEVYDYLKKQRALLIFDNSVNETSVYQYLPSAFILENTNLQVLLTSQFADWSSSNVTCFKLQSLDKKGALDLLERILGNKYRLIAKETDWSKLVRMLDYLPLAIQLAAAYIQKQIKQNSVYNIKDYIRKLQNETDNIHTSISPIEYDKDKTLYKSTKITLDTMAQENNSTRALELVNIAAYLNSYCIQEETLAYFVGDIADSKNELNEALQIASAYSLICQVGDTFYMHRLIQKSIRYDQHLIGTSHNYYKLALNYILNNEAISLIHKPYVFKYASDHVSLILDYYKSSRSDKLLQLLSETGCNKVLSEIFNYIDKPQMKTIIEENELLHFATLSKQLDTVRMMCQHNVGLNRLCEPNDFAPLHIACGLGCEDIVEFLLEQGANTDLKCRNGRTLLHHASSGLHSNIVGRLLQIPDIIVDERNAQNQTPLQVVLNIYTTFLNIDQILKIARLLIDKGASLETKNSKSATVLHIAAHHLQQDFITYLIDKHNLDVNVRDKNGFGPVAYAFSANTFVSEDDLLGTIKLLITNGSSAEATSNNGSTLLHCAADLGRYRILSYLLTKFTLDVNKSDDFGLSPLHRSLHANRSVTDDDLIKTIDLLIANGAVGKTNDNKDLTLLHTAARSGRYYVLTHLIDNYNLDVNAKDSRGQSPLYRALFDNKSVSDDDVMVTVKLLIERGADVSTRTHDGLTLLHCAARWGRHRVLSHLIEDHNLDVNMTDSRGQSPLYRALFDNKSVTDDELFETIKLLIEKKARVDIKTKKGLSLLHSAARWGRHRILSYLIEYHQLDVNMIDSRGQSPLYRALLDNLSVSEDDLMNTVKLLISKGAQVDISTSEGLTVLHCAARWGHHRILSYLIEDHKLDVNMKDSRGQSPLYRAFFDNRSVTDDNIWKTMKLLIEKGAHVDTRTNDGVSLLHCAARWGRHRALSYLIENYNLDVNMKNSSGQSPLYFALANNSVSDKDLMRTLNLLLANRAQVRTESNNGSTLLHVAAEFGHHHVILLLIEKYELDVNSINSFGASPLFCAFSASKSVSDSNVMKTVQLLITKGANVEARTYNGSTLLHHAAQYGQYEVLTYLLKYYNINIDAENLNGDTPLHCTFHDEAISKEIVRKIVEELLSMGASINKKNINGQTALDLAPQGIKDMLLKSHDVANKTQAVETGGSDSKRQKNSCVFAL